MPPLVTILQGGGRPPVFHGVCLSPGGGVGTSEGGLAEVSSEIMADLRHARILVVDDEDMVCRLFEAMFPHQVTAARDAEEALDTLEEQSFDLVITDIRLPKIDGISLLQEIRQFWPQLPVIVMTGYGRNFTVDQALEVGAADYIAKPFRQSHVTERIATVLRQSRLTADLARYQGCVERIARIVDAEADDVEGLVRQIRDLLDASRPAASPNAPSEPSPSHLPTTR